MHGTLIFHFPPRAQFAATASSSPTAASALAASRRVRTRENRRSATSAKSPERDGTELVGSPEEPSPNARLTPVEEDSTAGPQLAAAEEVEVEEETTSLANPVPSQEEPATSTASTPAPQDGVNNAAAAQLPRMLDVELPDLSTSFSRSELDLVQLVAHGEFDDSSNEPEQGPPTPVSNAREGASSSGEESRPSTSDADIVPPALDGTGAGAGGG